MRANLHAILDRHKAVDVLPGKLSDFTLGPAEAAEATLAAARPWSLYCLDLERREAVFVALPEGEDLAEAPFSGVTQFKLADRVLVAPLDAFETFGQGVEAPAPLVIVYSMGRCGSTLVNALLNTAPEMWALSEPWALDVFQDAEASLGRAETVRLLRLVAKALFRPPAHRRATAFAIKLRSQMLFFTPALREAFPDARNLFLYREGISWADSRYRTGQRIARNHGGEIDVPMRMWRRLAGYASLEKVRRDFGIDAENPTLGQMLAASWAIHLQRFEELAADGMRFFALRYEDLQSDRAATLARLFAYCGLRLPLKQRLMQPFARDSQRGTSLQRGGEAQPLEAAQVADFRATLARHPLYSSPDWRAPEIS